MLIEKGIRILLPSQASQGSIWRDEIDSQLASADLVIGVLTQDKQSDWVLFELGQAWASNRRILLLTSHQAPSLPSDLKRLVVVRTGLKNRSAIDFALSQMLAAPPPTKRIGEDTKSEVRGLGAGADAFINRAHSAIGAHEGLMLEHLVAEALRNSGVEVLAERLAEEQRADLAIWSDAFHSLVGNPLLVEVKSRIRGIEEARRVLHKFSQTVSSSGTRWGLLLYGEGPVRDERNWEEAFPNVLVLSVPSLFQKLRSQSFAEVVKDLRNWRVHGGRS